MTVESEIQRISDELEIRNLISRIALLADSGDLEEYGSLFAENAHWEMMPEIGSAVTTEPVKGRTAIVAAGRQRRADGLTGPGSHTYHAVNTTAITLRGDKAQARSYMVYYRNAHKVPETAILKVYRDEFVRTPDGWKLSIRHIDPEPKAET